ncbi:MAG TPA: hypothetical protein VE954_19465, partial [Oligoflexus sp.]|uniref:hypothetical protein n=1 Tax=Oligoflexus sp. TaxID=1971216 RepID=UPI002D594DED
SLDGFGNFMKFDFYLNYRHLSYHLVFLSLTVLPRFQIRRHQLADGPTLPMHDVLGNEISPLRIYFFFGTEDDSP